LGHDKRLESVQVDEWTRVCSGAGGMALVELSFKACPACDDA
jgi:hypothetical protein